MAETLKHKTLRGTIWSSIERFSVQAISFVVMIIMARILTPDDYGLVGMLTIFIAISYSLIDSGFSQALIRKQDRNETDNSTVFYFNIVVGIILYFVLFISAPFISEFYKEPLLTPIMRVIALSIPINSLSVVQRAILTTNIDFKTQAKASLAGTLIGGVLGIWMAYNGFGVWSIVWYQISSTIIINVIMWLLSKWRPKWLYSWKSFRELFSFGSKLAASSIISTLYDNIYLLVIGKIFSASDLGYYTRASQFAKFPSSNFTSVIQRVTYPILCTFQGDIPKLRVVYRKFLRLSAFIIFPLMIGLAAVAKPLILLLLNEQWAFSIILLQILCFAMLWYPVHAINLNLLQVEGRSDLFLRLEIIKKLIGITVLCITVPMGLISMCVGSIFTSIIGLIINTYYTGKIIQVGFLLQMRDLLPTLLYSLSMGIVVYGIVNILSGLFIQLIVGMITGIVYFLLITKITGSQDLREAILFFKEGKK